MEKKGRQVMPKRIQRKRIKDWRMPEGAIYVGRPTVWGNPFDWRFYGREDAVKLYEGIIKAADEDWQHYPFLTTAFIRRELRGKDLACWCPPGEACHADVLLRLANMEVQDDDEN